jgi:hypothetical protein
MNPEEGKGIRSIFEEELIESIGECLLVLRELGEYGQ